MSNLNVQPKQKQKQQTRYYITTSAATPSTPILKSSSTSNAKVLTSFDTKQIVRNQSSSSSSLLNAGFINTSNSPSTVNSVTNSKFISNFVPVLVTNSNSFNQSILPSLQQQQHQQQQKSNIANTGNIPTITNASIPLVTATSKPVIMATNQSNNITYQVLSAPNNANLNSVIAAGPTVNVLLTHANVVPNLGQTPILIRNQHQKQQQQQQQQQQLIPKQRKNVTIDVLKQIGSDLNSNDETLVAPSIAKVVTPRTTLLKASLLQAKQQQQQQKFIIDKSKPVVKNKIMITSQQPQELQQLQQQQQHKLQKPLIANKKEQIDGESSNQIFTTLGSNKGSTESSSSSSPLHGQKIEKISLLQNTKATTNNEVGSIEQPNSLLKRSNEVKVANVSAEVSLIKRINDIEDNSNNRPLLKVVNASSKLQNEITLKSFTTASLGDDDDDDDDDCKEIESGDPMIMEITESCDIKTKKSLLKSLNTHNGVIEDNSLLKPFDKLIVTPANTSLLKSGKCAGVSVEKQESLLKMNSKKSSLEIDTEQISPRHQRSQSWNALLKSSNNGNSIVSVERRRSGPVTDYDKLHVLKPLDISEINARMPGNPEKSQKLQMGAFFEEDDSLKLVVEEEEENEDIKKNESLASASTLPKNDLQLQHVMRSKSLNSSINPETTTKWLTNEEHHTLKSIKSEPIFSLEKNYDTKMEQKSSKYDSDSDGDDVTIVPTEEKKIEEIEIDDDDDDDDDDEDDDNNNNNNNNNEANNCPRGGATNGNKKSLTCEEQILISSPSSISNNSSENLNDSYGSLKKSLKKSESFLKEALNEPKVEVTDLNETNGYPSMLDICSSFNMLNWRDRVGTARGTTYKFQLNEFNLVQLYEKCPPRVRIQTAYEKPLIERECTRSNPKDPSPLLYLCRRCNCHGPAIDFLAPEFCSLTCLKRDIRKRHRDERTSILRKRARKMEVLSLRMVKKQPGPRFRWCSYLPGNPESSAAPISLFLNPFPTGPNNFKVGMKLEAIDPDNCSLFCVCTVIEINGYRLKLSFDGYDSMYDFWVNADSMDIFPPGWCAKTNRILQPPKGISANKFNWSAYLNKERGTPAPRLLFTHLNSSALTPRNPFKIGMHLEAEDLNDTGKLCVATIADVLDDRIRIHFDGWDDCYDIIVDINSPYIHPCGWHEGRQQLLVPPECENTSFKWNDYIRKQGRGVAANEELFAPREPINFRPNMKLEVVDPRNSSLIRPATVIAHKGYRVKLHLDCWSSDYCFWLEDDSPDLHPIGWCDATGHDLEPPPRYKMGEQKMPCPTVGCRGIGNAKKPTMSVHADRDYCPYAPENWRVLVEKPTRLTQENVVRSLYVEDKNNKPINSQSFSHLSDQQILDRLQVLDNIKPHHALLQPDRIPLSRTDFSSLPLTTETDEDMPLKSIKSSNAKDNENLDTVLQITKEFLCDYGPRLKQNYDLWQRNLNFDASNIQRNPLLWSTKETSTFIDVVLNCPDYAEIFVQQDIDGKALLLLQQDDLTETLGMKLGPAVKLYTVILQLRTITITKFNVAYKRSNPKNKKGD